MTARISSTVVLKYARMLPSLIRFSRSGLIQYLTLSDSAGRADDQRDLGAVAVAVERRLGGRVPGADHRDLLADVADTARGSSA